MRILCTNDDGVHAEGLLVLEAIARSLSEDVWVVAPETEQSGVSRALTLTAPVRVRAAGERRFAVSGTPTDCVLLAVFDLMGEDRPDLVLSGVNHGANLAEDVTLSGTVAGAIQGMHLGIPSIALSQTMVRGQTRDHDPFDAALAHGPGIVDALVRHGWPQHVVMNVNFPDLPAAAIERVEVTHQGERDIPVRRIEKRTDLRGNGYYWIGYSAVRSNPPEGVDLHAVYEGRISVTPLHLELTHRESVHALRGVLGGAPPRPR